MSDLDPLPPPPADPPADRLLSALPDPVALIDEAGRVAYCNRPFAALSGCDPAALTGLPLPRALGPELSQVALPLWQRASETGQRQGAELRLSHLLLSLRLFPAGDGQVVLRIESVPQQPSAATPAPPLQQAEAAFDQFIARVVSDLGLPLDLLRTKVEALTQVLRQGPRGLPQAVSLAEATAHQLRRTDMIMHHLSDLVQITQGPLCLAPSDLDLVEVIADLLRSVRREAEAAGCDVRLSAPDRLAGQWDRRRLAQVLRHLLSNAFRYGAGAPVDVTIEQVPGAARVRIQDHGCGIDPADHGRIFERFAQGAGERPLGSYGLGLWVVRRLVALMGGMIQVESRPGHGAAFTLTLPLR